MFRGLCHELRQLLPRPYAHSRGKFQYSYTYTLEIKRYRTLRASYPDVLSEYIGLLKHGHPLQSFSNIRGFVLASQRGSFEPDVLIPSFPQRASIRLPLTLFQDVSHEFASSHPRICSGVKSFSLAYLQFLSRFKR